MSPLCSQLKTDLSHDIGYTAGFVIEIHIARTDLNNKWFLIHGTSGKNLAQQYNTEWTAGK